MTDSVINVVQNSLWWLSPGAVFLSAVIGGFIALKSIKKQQEIARRRATLDVILRSESETEYLKAYAVFRSEIECDRGLEHLIDARSDAERSTKRAVDTFLNHYELIAIAIEKNILDDHFYKLWMKTAYIRHFDQAKGYIDALRTSGSPNAFTEYEKRVEAWRNGIRAKQ
ncbi:DUF4760 domain-containing protein [Alcanivoracaceae bacterium MT1]